MHFCVVDVMLVTSVSAYMGDVYAFYRVTRPAIDYESGLLVTSTEVKHPIKKQNNNTATVIDLIAADKLTKTVMKSTTQDIGRNI